MNGSNGSTTFIDNSPVTPHAVTANGNAQISTAQAKFCQSGLFDGTGDYLSLPDDDDWDFGSGDFTIDFWVRFNSLSFYESFYEQYLDGANHFDFYYAPDAGGRIFIEIMDGTGAPFVARAYDWVPSLNTWYHVALERSGSNYLVFINGTSIPQTYNDPGDNGTPENINNMSVAVSIGARDITGTWPLSGYLDEFRISKGIARWTGNFTPPANPYCD